MTVEVTCAEDLEELCLMQANITPAVDPAKCIVDLTAPAEVGKSYVGTLTTRLVMENQTTGNVRSTVTSSLFIMESPPTVPLTNMDRADIVSNTYPLFMDVMN